MNKVELLKQHANKNKMNSFFYDLFIQQLDELSSAEKKLVNEFFNDFAIN